MTDEPDPAPRLHPETLMLSHGYDLALSEGAVKPPVFLTSTFAFRSAEERRDYFDVVADRKEPPRGGARLVYSRFNHPNAEIVEGRLAVYEGTEAALLFGAGMAAEGFTDGLSAPAMEAAADRAMARGRVSVILIETPSNPLNTLVDLALVAALRTRIAERQGHTHRPRQSEQLCLGLRCPSILRSCSDPVAAHACGRTQRRVDGQQPHAAPKRPPGARAAHAAASSTFSVEHPEDLIADLTQALARLDEPGG